MTIEEVIARAIVEAKGENADSPVSRYVGGGWKVEGPLWKIEGLEIACAVLSALKAAGLVTEWIDADANVYPALVLKLGPSKGLAYVRREKRFGLLRQAMQRLRLTGKELDKDLANEIQAELNAP